MPGGGVKMGRQRRHEAWRSGGCSSRAFGISGVRGWGVGFWVVAASEWGEVLGFAVAGGWVPQRWVLILWVLAAGEWWVLCGSFFFGIGKQLNGNFLGPSRKNDKDNSLVEKTQWRGIFFFFFCGDFFLVLDWLRDASDQTDRCLLWYQNWRRTIRTKLKEQKNKRI